MVSSAADLQQDAFAPAGNLLMRRAHVVRGAGREVHKGVVPAVVKLPARGGKALRDALAHVLLLQARQGLVALARRWFEAAGRRLQSGAAAELAAHPVP